MRISSLAALGFLAATLVALPLQGADEPGWISLFDGKTLTNWKPSESPTSWKVEDGAIVALGNRSHLFYTGPEAPFKNFELKVDVMTEPGANGGIYFHTEFLTNNWPKKGYETQVNISHSDWRKTGSLYGVQDVRELAAQDNKWWVQHIIVQDKHVTIKIDGKTVVDYTEPATVTGDRKIGQGTFALQAHDPKSVIRYKNIRVKKLD